MKERVHYNVRYNNYFVEMNDGAEFVLITMEDRDKGAIDKYPVPIEIARNMAEDLLNLITENTKG